LSSKGRAVAFLGKRSSAGMPTDTVALPIA